MLSPAARNEINDESRGYPSPGGRRAQLPTSTYRFADNENLFRKAVLTSAIPALLNR